MLRIKNSRFVFALLAYSLGRNLAIGQPSSSPNPAFWSPNGAVFAAVETNGILYIGGGFSQIGPKTGSFVAADPASGALVQTPLLVGGSVSCCIGDGQGGVFIGGTFTNVGPWATTNLAHVLANGTFDPGLLVSADGAVAALAIYGSNLFIGGAFTQLNGSSNYYLAELSLVSNQLQSLPFGPDGPVAALALRGDNLYLGGGFLHIGGAARGYVGLLDLTSFQVSPWNPVLDSIFGLGVTSLVSADNSIYVIGDFAHVGATPRFTVAAFDAGSGALTSWDAQASAPYTTPGVSTLAVGSNAVYIGGNFTSLGGQPRSLIGAVDKTNGNALPWNPGLPATGVNALAISGNTVYVGGSFSRINSNGPPFLAALDGASASVLNWQPSPNNVVNALLSTGNLIYVGGSFNSVGGTNVQNAGAIDLNTGQSTGWNPNVAGNYVLSLAANGGGMFIGGAFFSVGGQPRESIGEVDLASAIVQPFAPNFPLYYTPSIFGIVPAGTNVVLTGNIPGPAVSYAVLGINSSSSANWNFAENDAISSFAATSNTLYVAGAFTGISGQARSRLAAFDLNSRQLLPWNPIVDNTVNSILIRDQSVIAVGSFLNANGQPCTNIAVFDAISGDLAVGPAVLTANGGLRKLTVSDNALYLAGDFTQINGSPRNYFAAVDLITGQPRSWNPQIPTSTSGLSIGWSCAVASNAVAIAGNFSQVGNTLVSGGLAVFPITNPPPLVQILTPANQAIAIAASLSTISVEASPVASAVSRVDIYVKTNLFASISNPPFTTNWVTPKHVGDYLVTAAAYDQFGEFALSPAARVTVVPPPGYIAPAVAFSFPATNGVYPANSTINVQTTVSHPTSAIEFVAFSVGTNVVATLTNAPYQIALTNLAPGTYTLTVRLQDEYGVRATNGPLTFTINAPPVVTLQSPADASTFTSGSSVSFSATVTDSNDTIAQLQFLNGTTVMATLTNPPFTYMLTNIPYGRFAFSALARNSFGSLGTSAVSHVVVYPVPQYDVIVDNASSNATFTGTWNISTSGSYYYSSNFATAVSGGSANTASATFAPNLPAAGIYDVFVSIPLVSGATTNSHWLIRYKTGITNVSVNEAANWGGWYQLASGLSFDAGPSGFVGVLNNTGEDTNRIVIADAVRLSSSVPVFILNQPLSPTVPAGANVGISAYTLGSTPMYFQWQFNGTNIANATGSAYNITRAQPSNAGIYTVMVSNAVSSVISSNAVLTVTPPARPRLGLPAVNTNGALQFTLTGGTGATFTIETSPDLITWTSVTNLINTNGSVVFTDPSQTNVPALFYRAQWLPQ